MNLLLIDDSLKDSQVFVTSVNDSTIPILYSKTTTRADILTQIDTVTIDRVGIVFSNEVHTTFLEGKPFFSKPLQPFSENVNFIISLIQEKNVKHIDYLGCNTLKYPDWAQYYTAIQQTGVVVGASDNSTGNLKYGGDWVMESTGQDIELIYFKHSIEYYKYLLGPGSHYSMIIKQNRELYGAGLGFSGLRLNLKQINITKTVASISCGANHTMVLMTDGYLYGTGNNVGQLGLNDSIYRYTLTQITTGVAAVSCGNFHTMVLKTDGSLYGTGYNNYGQLGLSNNTPTKILQQILYVTDGTTTQNIPTVASVTCGAYHTMVLMTDGSLYGTGRNNSGQLGLGDNTNRNTLKLVTTAVAAVSCGEAHTMVLKTDESLYGTGYNFYGQLGLGDNTNRNTLQLVTTSIISVSCGANHTMVITIDYDLYGTGRNDYGQLGLGDNNNINTLEFVTIDVASVTCGAYYTTVIMIDDSLYGTGRNDYGQLGLNDNTNRNTFQLMTTAVAAVSCGDSHTVVLKTESSLYGTGYHSYGQLGFGSLKPNIFQLIGCPNTPYRVSSSPFHTMVLTSGGDLYGTGRNDFGQLGLGDTTNRETLQLITTGVTSVTCGRLYTMVLKNGSLYGTGYNGYGQLGLGNLNNVNTLTQILYTTDGTTQQSITSVAAVSCGDLHTMVLLTNGSLYGSGSNTDGQLGLNDNNNRSTLEIVSTSVAAVSCGDSHTVVLMTDGSLYGTGYNEYGQLGLNDNTSRNTLTQILYTTDGTTQQSITSVAAVSCGVIHTIVLLTNGSLYGSGANTDGQLGLGNLNNVNTLTQILYTTDGTTQQSITSVAAVSCGAHHTVVLKTDGSLYGTGFNNSGQLALGDYDNRTTLQFITSNVYNIADSNVYIEGTSVPCFKEGSLILTDKGYVPIEQLRRGDQVKTSLDGFKTIYMIGKRDIEHFVSIDRIKEQLYVCTSDSYPEITEPLVLTGCHSILVDKFTSEKQKQNVIKVNGNTYVTDRKYRLPACVDERTKVYDVPGTYTIYHIALENDDYYMNYGIYANGLLVETCSKRYLKELSNMDIIE